MQKLKFSINFLTLLIIFTLNSCKETETQYNFEIEGEIRNSRNELIYLSKVNEDSLIIIDSCEIHDNKFNFAGQIEIPEMFYLSDKYFKNYTPLFVEKSNIKFYAKNLEFSDLKIEGSISHQQFTEFSENFSIYQKKYSYIVNHLSDSIFFDDLSIQLNDSTYETIKDERLNFLKNYVTQNNSSIVSVYITYKIIMHEVSKIELINIISEFSEQNKKSKYYTYIENFINK